MLLMLAKLDVEVSRTHVLGRGRKLPCFPGKAPSGSPALLQDPGESVRVGLDRTRENDFKMKESRF